MYFQQHEGSQRLSEIESRLSALEEKTEAKKFSEPIIQSLKNSIDDWLGNTLTVNCIKEEMERRYKRSRADLAEFVKEFKKSEKDIKEASEKAVAVEGDLVKLKSFVSDVTTDLKLKAYTGDLNRVERLLDTKFSLNGGNELIAQVKLLAKQEDLLLTQSQINAVADDLVENYFRKQDAITELEKILQKMLKLLEDYSTKEHTNGISKKFYKKIAELANGFEDSEKKNQIRYEFFDKNAKDLRSELSTKVGHKEIEKISSDLSGKATKNELSKYFSEINPKITGFQGELGVFNRIIREQEQALLRLDEVLLEKASKTETYDLYQKLSLISKHSDIEYKIDEMVKTQKILKDSFAHIESDSRQMQLQFSEIQTAYSKKTNDAMELKFLKDLMLDMQTSISHKADRTEVLNCLEQKAGWGDFSHLSQSLESVHRQLKLLAVQVGTIEKINAPKGKIRNAEKSQREYFNKITNRLVNYVVNSRPTIDEQPIPDEIKAFLKVPDTPKLFERLKSKTGTPNRRKHHSFDQLSNL